MHLRSIIRHRTILSTSCRFLQSYSPIVTTNYHRLAIRQPINRTSISLQRYLVTNVKTESTTSSTTKPEKHQFQAETQQLLHIVAKSLYSDKEIFIRELISNANDALEKLRYVQLSSSDQRIDDDKREISITVDDINKTLTIRDSGIGMTKAEAIENLGTIARSGSRLFLEELRKDKGTVDEGKIIGQFGVGFYSAFMVSKSVDVITRSYKSDEPAYRWSSDGSGSYEIESLTDDIPRGTSIRCYLRDDCAEFSKEETIKQIVKKYSNFVSSPIFINDVRANNLRALWMEDAKSITEDEHVEFYRFVTGQYDKPRYTLQYKIDVPINLRALIYIPQYKPNIFDVTQESDIGVALYSRKVLIQPKANQLLPRWLRFVKGVVDSEDIPLNLSRELLQDSNLIRKIRLLLTQRITRFLQEQAKKDKPKYQEFYEDYKLFFKEGIVRTADQGEKEDIAKLLRFDSSREEQGNLISLEEYIDRMLPDQKFIYYLSGPSRDLCENSPYYEAIRQKGYEVLFVYESHDEVILMQLTEFDKKKLRSVESELETETKRDDTILEGDSRSLTQDEANTLKQWILKQFGDKIKNVKINTKLDQHPCIITTNEMGAVRHFLKTNLLQRNKQQEIYKVLQLNFDINPKHILIKKLYSLHKSNNNDLANMLAQQLIDNALVTAGLIEDPRLVLTGLNKLLEKVLEKY